MKTLEKMVKKPKQMRKRFLQHVAEGEIGLGLAIMKEWLRRAQEWGKEVPWDAKQLLIKSFHDFYLVYVDLMSTSTERLSLQLFNNSTGGFSCLKKSPGCSHTQESWLWSLFIYFPHSAHPCSAPGGGTTLEGHMHKLHPRGCRSSWQWPQPLLLQTHTSILVLVGQRIKDR